MVMISSTCDRDLGRRTVGGAVSFDDIALADDADARASGGAAGRTGAGADRWAGAAGSFGDSFSDAPYAGGYPTAPASTTTSTPAATAAATPSRSELIAIYWQAHQGTPSTIIQGMRDFGVSVAEFAAATGQSVDALGRYLQAGGAEDGFGGWFAPAAAAAAAAAASVASAAAAATAAPSRSAIIADYWRAYSATPLKIIEGMRSYGVSVAEFAAATGQSVDALGRYLQAGGAEDGFGGWFAPVVAATTATALTSTRSAEHNALILVFWEANKNNVKTISDAMTEFKVSAAELAFATGQTLEQVERYLLQGAVAAATSTTATTTAATDQSGASRGTTQSAGSTASQELGAQAYGSTTTTTEVVTGQIKTDAATTDAKAPDSQLTPDQLTRVANYWTEHQADPYRIMQSMVENQVSAIDLAVATGQSVQDVADYLSRNGAPAGFAGSDCVDRRQVDAAFLNAINAARSAGVGIGWSVQAYTAQDDLGRDYTASKASFDHNTFTAWYASQDTVEAQTFNRLHGADFQKSGATYSAGYWQTHGDSDAQQWVVTNQIDWGHTARQAGERIHAYLGYAKADAQETAAMDLMLSEPDSQQLLAHFGGTASLPESEQSERMRARFGSARATELYRYGQASDHVRGLYVQALDVAKSQPPLDNTAEQPWWRITLTTQSWDFGEVRRTAEFDLQTFTTWYASQDTPASHLFKQLNSSEITTVSSSQSQGDNDPLLVSEHFIGAGAFLMSGGQLVGGDYPSWIGTTLTSTGGNGLMQINLGNPPEMFDPSLVLFDPMMGFATPFENVVPEVDWVGQLIPMVIGMVVAWYAAPAMAASVGAAGNAVVIAGASAVVSTTVTSLLTTGRIDLEDVLTSALTAVLTAGLSEALHLNTMGMGVDGLGNRIVTNWADKITAIGAKAVLGGVLSKISGGDFEVGAGQALAGALAGAVVDAMNVQIANNADLSATERSTMRLFAKAAGAAIRIMASPGDPRFAVASEFMNELLVSIDTKQTQGTGPWSDKDYENSFDLESDKISFAVNNPLIQDGRFVPDQAHDTALSEVNDELGLVPDPSSLYDDGAGDLGGDDGTTKVGWRDGLDRLKLSAAEYAQRVAARVGGELGDLLQRGLKATVDVISYGDIKVLQDVQADIRTYLDARAATGGLSEAEIMVFGVLCAANEALFPTNVLDMLGGVGKGIKAASNVIKAGKNADELAAAVRTESRALATEAHLADVEAVARQNGLQVVSAAQGTRGAWNDALNGKLQPKTVYMLDNGHTYVTDALGRVSKAEGVLDLNKVDRNTYQQIVAGKLGGEGYDGGHLIATLFGGAGEKINLVPQLSSVNRGEFRMLEKQWAQAVLDNKVVKVEVTPIYSAAGSVPKAVVAKWWVDGVVYEKYFPNT